jgi:flagellar capping protein FliD
VQDRSSKSTSVVTNSTFVSSSLSPEDRRRSEGKKERKKARWQLKKVGHLTSALKGL